MATILVVEDEQMLAKIIGMKLEQEQFQVIHAYDGQQAYELMSQPVLPDLVLLDLLLPKMGGFDILEKLKAEGKPLPKVIVFSNFAQQADVDKAHELGALDYIVKAAFSPAEILGKVKEVLDAPSSDDMSPVTQPVSVSASADNSYSHFPSMEEVKPMSEVLHPDVQNNNP